MKFKKILLILIVFILFISLTYFNAFYINPTTITVREEVIYNDKIKEDLNGLTILFFSDLHYGTSINETNIDKLIQKINSFDADIILFGGDLIDHFSLNPLNEDETNFLVQNLKDINGKYGKFAVYGNHDIDSPIVKDNVYNILKQSDFEVLENESVMVRKGGDSFIHIVGIDSLLLGNPDISSAYSMIKDNSYTIALCHTPDIFNDINDDKTDLMLSGHSHGGQIYFPFVNNLYRPIGTQIYFKGKYNRENTTLDITNGVGTTKKDIRLFADAEIVVYKFKSN